MRRSLPRSANLKAVENEAKHLLYQVRRGDAVAIGRWYSLDTEARASRPRAADIQYVIAREYGFKSWQSLKDQLGKDPPNSHASKGHLS
jgi:hypothetical protein